MPGPSEHPGWTVTDRRAAASRRGQIDILGSLGPDRIADEVRKLAAPKEKAPMPSPEQPSLPHLVMPAHHDVRPGDDLPAAALLVKYWQSVQWHV